MLVALLFLIQVKQSQYDRITLHFAYTFDSLVWTRLKVQHKMSSWKVASCHITHIRIGTFKLYGAVWLVWTWQNKFWLAIFCQIWELRWNKFEGNCKNVYSSNAWKCTYNTLNAQNWRKWITIQQYRPIRAIWDAANVITGKQQFPMTSAGICNMINDLYYRMCITIMFCSITYNTA